MKENLNVVEKLSSDEKHWFDMELHKELTC